MVVTVLILTGSRTNRQSFQFSLDRPIITTSKFSNRYFQAGLVLLNVQVLTIRDELD